MKLSLRSRLIIFLLVPLVFARALNGLYDYYVNAIDLRLLTDQRLFDAARIIAAGLRVGDEQIDATLATKVMEPLAADDVVSYSVYDARGHLIAGNSKLPTLPAADLNPAYAEVAVADRRMSASTYRTSVDGIDVSINVAIGAANVLNATRLHLRRNLLWDFLELDISVLFVWLAVAFALRPLHALRSELARRSAHDLSRIDTSDRPQELVALIGSLNRLLETLNNVLATQQDFISNAAHQLRTPIAGLTSQLELLRSEALPESVKQRTERLARGMRSLGHTANQLLTLARVDTAAINLRIDRTANLDEVVANVVALFLDRAVQLDVELSVETAPAQVSADAWMVEELLSNLVDNALKYTPAGGSVVIRCGVKADFPFLSVDDTGPGIPLAERKRVLQRFYRVPGSTGEGTGLGLAIVDEIARAYRATIHIGPGDGGKGTRVEIQWPSNRSDA